MIVIPSAVKTRNTSYHSVSMNTATYVKLTVLARATGRTRANVVTWLIDQASVRKNGRKG